MTWADLQREVAESPCLAVGHSWRPLTFRAWRGGDDEGADRWLTAECSRCRARWKR